MSARTLVAAAAIVTLIAGCGGPPAQTQAASSLAPAPEASTSPETGAIAGQVIDDESRPLGAVEVAIVGTERSTASDETGRFTFNGLEGGAVVLAAAKLGYESSSKRIDVKLGETTEVTFILLPIVIAEPRIDKFIGNGFVQFSVTGPSSYAGGSVPGLGVLPEDKQVWSHPIADHFVGAVGTGDWERTLGPSATWMALSLRTDADHRASVQGKTELTVHLVNVTTTPDKKVTVSFYPTWGCGVDTSNPTDCANDTQNRAAQVVLQQKTTVYTDTFYVNPPPPDYKAGPTA